MTDTLRKLLAMIRPADRRKLGWLVVAMSLGSALEALGIGLILPYLNAVTEPHVILEHEVAGPALEWVGITGTRQVLVASSVAIVAVFVAKNGYVAWMWRKVYDYLYRQYAHMSRELLEGYLAVPYTFHLQRNTAELVRNTTVEPRRVLQGAVQSALEIIAEGLVIVGLVAVLAFVHTLAAGVVFAVLALAGWGLTGLFRSKLERVGTTRAEQKSRMIQTVNESLGGLKEVKLLGREGELLRQFTEQTEAVAVAERENSVINKYPRIFLEAGAVIAMVGLAGLLVFTGVSLMDAIPITGVFAVAAIRLMPSVNRVVNQVNSLRYEGAAIGIVHRELEQIERLAEERTDRGGRPAFGGWSAIGVRDLAYRYPGADVPALEGVDFDVARGEHVGVVGPSGAGKSTLVNVVLGLLEPDAGGIEVDGTDVRERLGDWQRRLGYIPQETYLTDQTIRRNVGLGLPEEKIDDRSVWEALQSAQLAGFVSGLEEGLDTVVGERGVRISGGQRQRVAIARALYHEPEVLVLDEATSSLDYETERKVTEAVNALAGDRTILTVTHRLNTVRKCDTLHVLSEGRLAASGRYGELESESLAFRRMARAQEG